MLLRRLIQFLRHLLQGIPNIIHKRRWIHFLLRPLILLHQQLFRPSPRTTTQVDGSQQQSRTHSIARSVGQVGEDGAIQLERERLSSIESLVCLGETRAILASHIPSSIVSTSDGLPEPPSPSDIPYIVGHEDSHQRSPCSSVRDALEPFNQENTRWVDQTLDPVQHESSGALLQPCAPRTGRHPHFSPDVVNSRESIHHNPEGPHLHHHHDTFLTTSDAPIDPTYGPLNFTQANRYLSSSQSLHNYAPSTPRTIDTSCSVASLWSVGTHRSVKSFNSLASAGRASYRRHEGTTPHARSLHPYDNHSAANSHSSLSPRIVIEPGGGLIATPKDNNEPGDPIPYTECPRFAQMTSGDVRRYQKSCFR